MPITLNHRITLAGTSAEQLLPPLCSQQDQPQQVVHYYVLQGSKYLQDTNPQPLQAICFGAGRLPQQIFFFLINGTSCISLCALCLCPPTRCH